ncbi:hypothetical protein ABPG72_020418 [Tetrahymena utriculariae]
MSKEIDYKKLYEQYKEDFEDLKKENEEIKATTDEIQSELEQMLQEAEQKIQNQEEQLGQMKDQLKKNKAQYEDQISRLEREQERYKQDLKILEEKYIQTQKSKVDLENDNEILISQNRMFEAMVADLEARIDQSLEELALVQTELEDNKNNSQEHIERLKQQLQETEQELFAVQVQNQKKIEALEQNVLKIKSRNEEDSLFPEKQANAENSDGKLAQNKNIDEPQIQLNGEHVAKDQNSPIKLDQQNNSSQLQDELSKKITLEQKLKNCSTNIQQLRLNNQGFKKSLNLVSALIKDLDEKMNEIRDKRKKKQQQKLQTQQNGVSNNNNNNYEYIQITQNGI